MIDITQTITVTKIIRDNIIALAPREIIDCNSLLKLSNIDKILVTDGHRLSQRMLHIVNDKGDTLFTIHYEYGMAVSTVFFKLWDRCQKL